MQEVWHNFIDAKCRWRSDRLDGAGSNREPLGQMKVMKIHQGAITHEICCSAAQLIFLLLTAFISMEVKNNHSQVTMQESFNKIIEMKFSVGYMVWP